MEIYTARVTESSDRISDEFLRVNNFGHIKNIDIDMHSYRENGRMDYQIIYIDKGYGFFLFNDEYVRVDNGNVVIIPPHLKNDYFYTKDSSTNCYWIHFTGSGAEELLKNLRFSGHIFKTGKFYEFMEIFEKMTKACIENDYTSESYLASCLYMILSLCGKKLYVPDSPIHKILDEMRNTKISEYKNTDFAEKCGLSRYHFIREFKKVTGKTPHKYMAEITITKAIELLTTTNMNISETAYYLGFEDNLYFSRFFKNITGISPKQYVKKIQH